jgi:hypothetical protein
MSLEHLISKTRGRFPRYEQHAVEIFSLEKGGSDRKYYRVAMSEEYSLILVKYDPQRAENARFVAIANFLEDAGVNAPFVYYHDPVEGLIWMQDLWIRSPPFTPSPFAPLKGWGCCPALTRDSTAGNKITGLKTVLVATSAFLPTGSGTWRRHRPLRAWRLSFAAIRTK